ncbi:MAG: sugar transferase [Solirubrobacterales bacterium]|nr:sugar transferase [Solirubrobacterales bacterium]
MTPPPAIEQAARAGATQNRFRVAWPFPELLLGASNRLADSRTWGRVRLLVDVMVLSLASSMALFADASIRSVPSNRLLAAVFTVVVLTMMHVRRAPDDRLNGSLLDTGAHVLGVVSLAAMLTIAVDSILGSAHPLTLGLRLWMFAAVYLGVARVVLLSLRRRLIRSQALAARTLIVGAGVIGSQLVERLVGEPSYGLRPVGFLDADPLPRAEHSTAPSVPVLGGLDDLGDAIEATGARHVILAFSSEPDHVLVAKVRQCQQLGVDVSLVPRLYESINERAALDHVGGLPLLRLRAVDPRGWQFAVKHALDRGVALIGLLAMAPVMGVIALFVRFSSPGPILFRQQRMGRDGREFTMLKFRTMRGSPSANGEADAGWAAQIRGTSAHSVPDALDRTTPVGRVLRATSLDELPQLINVLRGEMSLVGPRPERLGYARDFELLVDRYTDRHRVKSGITGLAQVNGLRGETSIAQRVEWDNHYIQNWSLGLDFRIIALTIAEILRFRG